MVHDKNEFPHSIHHGEEAQQSCTYMEDFSSYAGENPRQKHHLTDFRMV